MSDADAERLLVELRTLSARYRGQLGPEVAADLAAEALARGLRRPPPDGRMGPWLERILRNLVIDHWRRAARPLHPPVADAPATPEDLALVRERRRALARSLARLSPELRRSLLLRYSGEGEGSARSTARTRVHRALRRLRELMKGFHGIFPSFTHVPVAAVVALFVAQQSPVEPPPTAPISIAQPHPRAAPTPAPRAAPPVKPSPPPPRRYDFDDDEITGDIQRPHDVLVVGPGVKPRHPSLIEIPDSFLANIAKSLDEL